MTSNVNPKTGIAYGYISANALHPDTVDSLMFGNGCSMFRDISAEEFEREYRREHGLRDNEELPCGAFDCFEPYESDVEGICEGVHFASSWLGGALNFFIFESPCITGKARRASPCVPNAGILDTLDGAVESYDVPADWRYNEESE